MYLDTTADHTAADPSGHASTQANLRLLIKDCLLLVSHFDGLQAVASTRAAALLLSKS